MRSTKISNFCYFGGAPLAFRHFAKINNFTCAASVGQPESVKRFLETGHYVWSLRPTKPLPGLDHGLAFKAGRSGPRCIVSQPYADLEILRGGLRAWEHDSGVEIDLYSSACSFYYPGSTCLFVVRLPGTTVAPPPDAAAEVSERRARLAKALSGAVRFAYPRDIPWDLYASYDLSAEAGWGLLRFLASSDLRGLGWRPVNPHSDCCEWALNTVTGVPS
jgi:hypothetical protein